MNYIKLLSLSFLLLSISCQKSDKEDSSANTTSIKGTWEVRKVYGGYGPPGRNPNYPPGNGNIWKFTDSTYHYYSNGQELSNGIYSVTEDTSPATGKLMDALILDKDNHWKLCFEIKGDTLTIYRGTIAADGTIEKYVKIEEAPVSTK